MPDTVALITEYRNVAPYAAADPDRPGRPKAVTRGAQAPK